jgi:hypothetical protein
VALLIKASIKVFIGFEMRSQLFWNKVFTQDCKDVSHLRDDIPPTSQSSVYFGAEGKYLFKLIEQKDWWSIASKGSAKTARRIVKQNVEIGISRNLLFVGIGEDGD